MKRTAATRSICKASICTILLGTIVLLVNPARADHVVPMYEIRHQPVLGRIVIEASIIRGEPAYLRAKNNRSKLARKDIFINDTVKKTTKRRTLKLGKFSIKIELTMSPSPGQGYGGAKPRASLRIWIGKTKKIDIPLGYEPLMYDVSVNKIVIHEDGVIEYEIMTFIAGKSEQLDMNGYEFFDTPDELGKKLTEKALAEAIEKQRKRHQ